MLRIKGGSDLSVILLNDNWSFPQSALNSQGDGVAILFLSIKKSLVLTDQSLLYKTLNIRNFIISNFISYGQVMKF